MKRNILEQALDKVIEKNASARALGRLSAQSRDTSSETMRALVNKRWNKNMIEIWCPKYSTDEVLIGTHKVSDGENKIIFTKAPHLKGNVYTIQGDTIRSYRTQKNGKGSVYVVPMSELSLVTK